MPRVVQSITLLELDMVAQEVDMVAQEVSFLLMWAQAGQRTDTQLTSADLIIMCSDW